MNTSDSILAEAALPSLAIIREDSAAGRAPEGPMTFPLVLSMFATSRREAL